MRRGAVGLLLVLACEPSPPSSGGPATAPPESAAPPKQPEAPAPQTDAPDQAPDQAPVSLCVRMCTLQAQARALGPEVINRDCEKRCGAPPSPDCGAFAAEARGRVEGVPMHERAAKVWAELSNPAFYCGYGDPFTRGLVGAATDDLDARATALGRALDADPFREDACPTGAELEPGATATAAIAACGLDEPSARWQDDVDASSYLALRAVRLRLQASGLYADDRTILLDTLVLATALANEE